MFAIRSIAYYNTFFKGIGSDGSFTIPDSQHDLLYWPLHLKRFGGCFFLPESQCVSTLSTIFSTQARSAQLAGAAEYTDCISTEE